MVNATTHGGLGQVGIALAFAFVVFALVFSISGAHLNPAVTIAFWSAGLHPTRSTLLYVLAQCMGAAAGSLTLRAVLGPVGQMGATVPAVPVPAAFALEALLSFVLMFVIVATAMERSINGISALAIGLTVGFDALVGGPLTGASMNPARSLGPALVGGVWTAHWVYWLAPISGMIAAVHIYGWLRAALPRRARVNQRRGSQLTNGGDRPSHGRPRSMTGPVLTAQQQGQFSPHGQSQQD